jgi:glycine dehydrogenase subunit 2
MRRPASEPLLIELSAPGRRGYSLDEPHGRPEEQLLPASLRRKQPPALPEVAEPEVVRHFVRLSQKNFSVDSGFYPLGSCTMKYNPKVNELLVRRPDFAGLHPLQPLETVQGLLALLAELECMLCEIAGMARFTLSPAAGAQGELCGMLLTRAYHRHRGESRRKVLVPDNAHGTNPSSVTVAGFEPVPIRSNDRGTVHASDVERHLDDSVAALMMTNPNTLGMWETDIVRIAEMVHQRGALLYYDGANLNAIVGRCRPGDMGFDIVHLNLHKTFSTPHGGGGPGAGPVGVTEELVPFLPIPVIEKTGDSYQMVEDRPLSIGRLHSFCGNVGVLLRAYAYIRQMGADGLREVSNWAVLNANYLKKILEPLLPAAVPGRCMHEFVLTAEKIKAEKGITAMHIAKRLLDFGVHAPTVYFPLIVPEAIMIEPTETETPETLRAFRDAVRTILEEADQEIDTLRNAPHTTPVSGLDEVAAARKPNLSWTWE